MRFAERMALLAEEQRLHFSEVPAHNLTVAIRGVWSDEHLSDAEKVERIKWINEILHRATAKVYVLRLKTHEWTEEDFGSLARGYADSHRNYRAVHAPRLADRGGHLRRRGGPAELSAGQVCGLTRRRRRSCRSAP
jgi:hypothetical protein